MVDYSGARQPKWRFELLDVEDNPLRDIDVLSATFERAALSRLGGAGSMRLDGKAGCIDWMQHRVRAWHTTGVEGGSWWAIATLLFSSPLDQHDSTGVEYDVGLLSKLAIVDEDSITEGVAYPEGTRIIDTVVLLIRSTGETRIAVTPSDATLSTQVVFEAGESKLTIINKLLEAAGYWSLWCDGLGQFRVEPWQEIAARPVAYEFGADKAGIIDPKWEREQDMSSVPNRFIVVGQGTDEEAGPVGVAENLDPDSPYSYQARGRWIVAKDEGVEVADVGVANLLAQRRLLDAMSPVAKLKVAHAIVPLEPNEVVVFSPGGGIAPVRATVMNLNYSTEFAANCESVWREA